MNSKDLVTHLVYAAHIIRVELAIGADQHLGDEPVPRRVHFTSWVGYGMPCLPLSARCECGDDTSRGGWASSTS
jgi:hypothetical protein